MSALEKITKEKAEIEKLLNNCEESERINLQKRISILKEKQISLINRYYQYRTCNNGSRYFKGVKK